MDPRNPKRPLDESGDNWVVCRHCDRAAHHAKDIRHTKACRSSFARATHWPPTKEPLDDRRAAEGRTT